MGAGEAVKLIPLMRDGCISLRGGNDMPEVEEVVEGTQALTSQDKSKQKVNDFTRTNLRFRHITPRAARAINFKRCLATFRIGNAI
jgi:hypothetical protein